MLLSIIVLSCSEKQAIENSVYDKIKGEWLEETDSICRQWTFNRREVNTGGFIHYFKIIENEICISGIRHEVLQLNKDTLKIVNQDSVVHVFHRKVKEKVEKKT